MPIRFFLGLLFALGLSQGQASEGYHCVFTEPFVRTHLNVEKPELVVAILGEESPLEFSEVGVIESSDGKVRALAQLKGEKLQLTIDKNTLGNDGMSDCVFPYEGVLGLPGKRPIYGGCETVENKRQCPY